MLDELTPEDFEGWWQYYQCQPWGDDWERSSLIAAQFTNCMTALASSFSGNGAKHEPLDQDAFVPWRHNEKQEEDKQKAIDAAMSIEGL
jgi:hypothetical protein